MSYAITQSCCNDATCVSVCPVNCIHPTPDEPDFGTTDMLYIDGDSCIDCGACADACPVDAIRPADRLFGPESIFVELNAQYYADRDVDHTWGEPQFPRSMPTPSRGLRVAVVGTGPAASYTAQELLYATDAEVTMIDRLPVPGGLVRAGVAPDHPSTKRIGDSFASMWDNPRLHLVANLDVGRDVSREEVLEHHHAVVYATGAASDRALDVPGEDLPGSISATDVVRWYNGDPLADVEAPVLTSARAVVVGNGNVGLDVARILTGDPDHLATTDIADEALAALRDGALHEVVVLGRRGPEHAAYTGPELVALAHRLDAELVVADDPDTRAAIEAAAPGTRAALLRDVPMVPVDLTAPPAPGRRIVLAFGLATRELVGDSHVTGVRTARGDEPGPEVATGLVVRAVGYRGRPVADLPFEDESGTVPHEGGGVVDADGARVPGTYVAGWIKRGPSGGIGANRTCAADTVATILDDLGHGRVPAPRRGAAAFARLVRKRQGDALGLKHVLNIDRTEREAGAAAGRPRVKLTTVPDLLAAGRGRKR
ncbi:FAD-dependent oxidoreductase [Solicola sp. PLA-1-18]|uniref:FAD-dependent oxidoreductase n=1 Tax=Solicola sp. PLA-1-18 TaxID=3380532 RepID=UPI003B7D5AA1